MASSGGNGIAVAEINVTPLIDVLLVLLIIFMVIVPVAPHGLETLLSQPSKMSTADTPPQTIVVEVLNSRNGVPAYKINQESFLKEAIEPELAGIFRGRQQKTMFIKGDPDLLYSAIAEVVDLGHQAGVDEIGIITTRSVTAR